MHSRVRVPASSANLGPGFDALGLALGIYLECEFRAASELSIRVTGRDAARISTGLDNLIWQTALAIAHEAGRTLDPIELEIRNDIPLGKGLGSSAAALTAGIVIADQFLGLGWDRGRVLHEAARFEGHPDNAAACVLGSIVASAVDTDGVARAVRLPWPERFGVAIVVPDFVLPTSEARTVLPSWYSREDAVFNVQRSTLLVAALSAGDSGAFPAALEDRIHQPYRAHLVPGLEELAALKAPGLLGCVLSGAGPSILIFFERGHEEACDLACDVLRKHQQGFDMLRPSVAHEGYQLF